MTQSSTPHSRSVSNPGIHRRRRRIRMSDIVLVAIIGAVATIIATVLSFPPVIQWFQMQWFPSPTPTATAFATPTDTSIPSTFTKAPSATLPPTETTTPIATPTSTFTPSPTPVPPKMVIKHWSNRLAGTVPVNIQFSVNGSYVEYADGKRSYCSSTSCKYFWSVILIPSNKIVATPQPWQETFGFSFPKAGLYKVVVRVCQENICSEYEFQVEGRQ